MIRTQAVLENISQDLLYEIAMLFKTANELLKEKYKNETDTDIWLIKMALIESFAIHTRAIIQFLFNGEFKDDVIACHFFDNDLDWKKKYNKEKMPRLLGDYLEKANKRAAHLTYTRLNDSEEEKKWEFITIPIEIGKILNDFFNKINIPLAQKNYFSLYEDFLKNIKDKKSIDVNTSRIFATSYGPIIIRRE